MPISAELRKEIRAHRKPEVLVDGKLIPGSIPFLRGLLKTVKDIYERDDLLSEMAGEYLRGDLSDEHLLIQRERLRNHPDAAIMWLAVAEALSYNADGGSEAKEAAAKGVAISRAEGTLIRHALSVQAFIARRTGDSCLFQKTLVELIEDAPVQRAEDCALFPSLIANLPPGICSPNVVEDYKRALEKSGT